MFTKKRRLAGMPIVLILLFIVGTLEVAPLHNNMKLSSISNAPVPTAITIPTLTDWQVNTLAFSHGARGKWDYYLWGGFANSLVKKDGIYYLYYQGSPSYDDQCESVADRGIGLAKSVDGVNWVKSAKNPVITWSGRGSIEEGAVSSAAWVGNDGRVYIYYGANTGSDCNVHANARLAVSDDGERFQDLGTVLSWDDPAVWGFGDELFPVGAYSHQNKWYLYYIPNGVSLSRKLGVAIGDANDTFTQSNGLNNSTLPAWGPVSVVLDNSNGVLFTNPGNVQGLINVYRFNASNPSVVNFHDSYAFSDCRQASVLHDDTTGRWLMACRNANQNNYLIKHAGAIPPITSPATFVSFGSYDGWIRESGESSNLGGVLNRSSSVLRVGDDSTNRQYRAILSFNTSGLPDTAVITSVTLKIKHAGLSGANPFLTHGNLLVDVRKGPFKNEPALELGDFNARASKNKVLIITDDLMDGWYTQTLNPLDFPFIHLNGLTQFRLRFAKDDNNDFGADFLKLFSGNAAEANRPQLVIEYDMP